MVAKTPKCRHCECVIELDQEDNETWIHIWSATAVCIRVFNRQRMDTVAAPRPDK